MSKLNELLNTIVEEFECEAVESNEFAYYYAENKICYTLESNEEVDSVFLALVRANGLDERVGAFVISFFHELGHNETIDEIEEEFEGDKDSLSLEEYFNLEEEWIATEWAIDYCNSHIDIVEQIQALL